VMSEDCTGYAPVHSIAYMFLDHDRRFSGRTHAWDVFVRAVSNATCLN
jgi:hypothetical protein